MLGDEKEIKTTSDSLSENLQIDIVKSEFKVGINLQDDIRKKVFVATGT